MTTSNTSVWTRSDMVSGWVADSPFIIDEEGRIIKVFPKVKVKNDSQEVLAVLKGQRDDVA